MAHHNATLSGIGGYLAEAGTPHWQRHPEQIGPMTAGLEIQATTNLHSLGWTGALGWSPGALLRSWGGLR